MIDQEQTTDTPNSETDQTTNDQSSDQRTSSTTVNEDQDRVDIGAGKGDDDDQDQDQDRSSDDDRDQETDEQKAEREEREAMFGAPAEGEDYAVTGLPEGMEIDKGAVEALTPLARKLNLSNEGFSALAQVYANDVLPGVSKQIVDGINNDVVEQRKTWETETRNLIAGKGDPLKTAAGEKIDFGGRSMKEVQALAAKTLDKIAPAGFRAWLDETGLGVHPQMIGLAFAVGKDLIAEDRDLEPADHGGDGKPKTSLRKSGGMDPEKFYDRS